MGKGFYVMADGSKHEGEFHRGRPVSAFCSGEWNGISRTDMSELRICFMVDDVVTV